MVIVFVTFLFKSVLYKVSQNMLTHANIFTDIVNFNTVYR